MGGKYRHTINMDEVDEHIGLMLEYDREAVKLAKKIPEYTEWLKSVYRQQYKGKKSERSIKRMAFDSPIRRDLIADQQMYDRWTMRESDVARTLMERNRWEVEMSGLAVPGRPTLSRVA